MYILINLWRKYFLHTFSEVFAFNVTCYQQVTFVELTSMSSISATSIYRFLRSLTFSTTSFSNSINSFSFFLEDSLKLLALLTNDKSLSLSFCSQWKLVRRFFCIESMSVLSLFWCDFKSDYNSSSIFRFLSETEASCLFRFCSSK